MSDRPIDLVAAALCKAQAEVQSVPMTGRNDFHDYSYDTAEDWANYGRPLLAKHGLCLVTQCEEAETLAFGTPPQKGEKVFHRVRIKMIGQIIHTSGQWLSVSAYGEGRDMEDKATYKAETGARKRIWKAVLNGSTTDDPEVHDSTHEGVGNGRAEDVVRASGRVPEPPEPTGGPQPVQPSVPGPPLKPTFFDEALRFGKHKGKTWGELLGEDPDYLSWIYRKMDPKGRDGKESPAAVESKRRAGEALRFMVAMEDYTLDKAQSAVQGSEDASYGEVPSGPVPEEPQSLKDEEIPF